MDESDLHALERDPLLPWLFIAAVGCAVVAAYMTWHAGALDGPVLRMAAILLALGIGLLWRTRWHARRVVARMLEIGGAGVLSLDAQLRVRYVSPRAMQWIADARRAYRRQPLLEVFPQLAGTQLLAAMQGTLRDRVERRVEDPGAAPGSWFESTVAPLARDGLLVSLRDVSERKRTELALRDALARLNDAQRIGQMGDWVLDPAKGTFDLSDQTLANYGYAPGECPSYEEVAAQFAPDQRAVIETQLARALSEQQTVRYELQRVARDGSVHDEVVIAVPETTADGQPRLRGIVQDVTVLRRAERALAAEAERLTLAVAAADIGLWEWDVPTGHVVYSETWRRQLGIAPDAIAPTLDEWQARLHPDDVEHTMQRVTRYLQQPDGLLRNEFRLRHSDGRYRWMLSTASAVRTSQGRAVRLLGAHVDITDMKRDQDALQLSERRLASAQRRAGIGSWELELPSETRAWSEEMYRVFGRDRALGPPSPAEFRAMIHPEDRAMFEDHYARQVHQHVPLRLDFRVVRGSGDVCWVEGRSELNLDEQGRLRRVLGTAQDITERKQREAEVADARARVVRVLDNLGPRMFAGLCAADGTLEWVNRALLDIAGLKEADVLGRHFAETYWWAHSRDVSSRLRGAMAQAARGERVLYDERVRVGEEAFIWIDFCVQPVRDLSDRLAGLVVSAFDITGRVHAQQQADARAQVLRGVFDNVADALFMLDVEAPGRYRYAVVNAAHERSTGLAAGEVVGRLVEEVSHSDALVLLHARLRHAVETRQQVAWEQAWQGPEGMRHTEVSIAPLCDAHGRCTQVVGVLHDVTAIRQAALHQQRLSQRLVEVQEAEQRRLSAELHDRIGSALTGLSLNFELLHNGVGDADARNARLNDTRALIEQTIAAVRGLVTELRPPALVDYGLLAGLRGLAQDVAGRAGLAVSVNGQEPAPRLPPAVETALYRIAQEALANALKHSGARRVQIDVAGNAHAARVTVRDDGHGFDAAQPPGDGHWGLALMRERAAAVGAEVVFDSAPGRGTYVLAEVRRVHGTGAAP